MGTISIPIRPWSEVNDMDRQINAAMALRRQLLRAPRKSLTVDFTYWDNGMAQASEALREAREDFPALEEKGATE